MEYAARYDIVIEAYGALTCDDFRDYLEVYS